MAKQLALLEDDGPTHSVRTGSTASYAARLITQGKHRFFTLTMPSDVLAETCVVDTREENQMMDFSAYSIRSGHRRSPTI
jgi:hypothetical protein